MRFLVNLLPTLQDVTANLQDDAAQLAEKAKADGNVEVTHPHINNHTVLLKQLLVLVLSTPRPRMPATATATDANVTEESASADDESSSADAGDATQAVAGAGAGGAGTAPAAAAGAGVPGGDNDPSTDLSHRNGKKRKVFIHAVTLNFKIKLAMCSGV